MMGDIIKLQLDQVVEAVKKENRQFLADYLTENLLMTHTAAQALVQVRALEKVLATVASGLIDQVLKHGIGDDLYGATVKTKRIAQEWDYAVCGDPVLGEMEARQKELKKEIDSRKTFLENIGGEDTVDRTTGEVTKTNNIRIKHMDADYTINRAALLESGQTVEVRLPN